ncbi:MAG: AzlD domain-containing protein, partial [Pseudomonadota bacterium]
MSTTVWIIIAAAAATYATRAAGHIVLSRFNEIPPRVEAALNAVPAAVLTTIVVPSLAFGSLADQAALIVAGIAALYLPPLGMFAVGWIAVL